MSNCSSPLSSPTFTPEVREILGRLIDHAGHIELLGNFLLPSGYNSVLMIASMKNSMEETLEIFKAYLTETKVPRLICAHLPITLRRLIEECHAASSPSPSPSLSASSASSPSSPSSMKKRRSESDSPQQPRIKKFDASKFALLNPSAVRFWLYVDVFASLLEDTYGDSVKCPACNEPIAASNPHDFFNHTYIHCPSRGDAFLASPATQLSAPRLLPPADIAARLCSRSESALACVPLCWLAMLPSASLPASIRAQLGGRVEGGTSVAALAAGMPAVAAAVRDAPAAIGVPESAQGAMVAEETHSSRSQHEDLPQH